jgi:thimet oligopeptidase
MKVLRAGVAALAAVLVVSTTTGVGRTAGSAEAPFTLGLDTPEAVTATLSAHLTTAQQLLDRFLAKKAPRTVENTLRAYDEITLEINRADNPAFVFANMHPDLAMQKAADAVLVRAKALEQSRHDNPAVYAALAAINASHADAETQYYLRRVLTGFRLDGVDKDAATREKLRDLRAKLAETTSAYRQNQRTWSHTMIVSAEDLDGLPPDYIARHKPDPTGAITLRADLADLVPLLTNARIGEVRKRAYMELTTIAYPANDEVLKQMVTLRSEIAHLLGFDSFAGYMAASRMTGTADAVVSFVQRTIRDVKPKVDRDYAELLKQKAQDVPGATTIEAWDYQYYRERVRKVSYNFDSQSVRPYFAYDRVRDGLIAIAGQMFGLVFRERKDIPVWDPLIQVYDVFDEGKLIGRVYLDTHPRPNKQGNGGMTAQAERGVEGRQLPEAVVQISVPGGQPGDPGLLTFTEVRDAFFHEFAHALDDLYAGHHQYVDFSYRAEDDASEVVARMFEAWPSDPHVLATFARHYQTNEPMPADLVERLRRANEFGKGMTVASELGFAHYDQAIHQADPATLDVAATYREVMTADAPWQYGPGVHREASFPQLANGVYAGAYYTYSWSQAIGRDLLTQFDQNNLLARGPAQRFRDTVLKAGGSAPAAVVFARFLGRPFDQRAWTAWINRDPS